MKDLLLNTSIFNGISDESKEAVKKIKKRVIKYKVNEQVIRAGDRIDDVCIITNGLLRCIEVSPTGKDLDAFYFSTGVTFPFYMLFGGEKYHSFNTFAVKKTTAVWIPWKELEPIIRNDKVFMNNILIFVSEFMCYSKMIARCIEYRKVIERISYWLLHLTKSSEAVYVPMSQEILSDILKVNRSSLNQELVNLQRLNVIEIKNKEIKIIDREYLETQL